MHVDATAHQVACSCGTGTWCNQAGAFLDLEGLHVLEVDRHDPARLVVAVAVGVETADQIAWRRQCDSQAKFHARCSVPFHDIPAHGPPVVLTWKKRVFRSHEKQCAMATFTEEPRRIGPGKAHRAGLPLGASAPEGTRHRGLGDSPAVRCGLARDRGVHQGVGPAGSGRPLPPARRHHFGCRRAHPAAHRLPLRPVPDRVCRQHRVSGRALCVYKLWKLQPPGNPSHCPGFNQPARWLADQAN